MDKQINSKFAITLVLILAFIVGGLTIYKSESFVPFFSRIFRCVSCVSRPPTPSEIEDIENFSFNTSVSTFMIAVNELTALKCNKRAILEPLAIIIEPYAPHIAEELWEKLGYDYSISNARFPEVDEKYLIEEDWEYPVSFNGKLRFKITLPLEMDNSEIETIVLKNEKAQKWLGGKPPKKIIIVPKKIINVVV